MSCRHLPSCRFVLLVLLLRAVLGTKRAICVTPRGNGPSSPHVGSSVSSQSIAAGTVAFGLFQRGDVPDLIDDNCNLDRSAFANSPFNNRAVNFRVENHT